MAATTTTSPIDMNRMNRLHMDRVADEDEDPTLREGIKYPGKHDVMLGRGGESTYHCGNIAFRQLVEDHKTKYYTCPRAHKSRVVAEVVKKWRQMNGRFLTRTNPSAGDKSPWHDVGDSRALKKASHSLRDAVRCFSVEKKQRALELQQEEKEEAEISVSQPDTRKRSRPPFGGGSAFFLANTRVAGNKLGRELEMVAARKPKIMVSPTFEERPAKRQRVVCDEREEAQEDCRRGDDDEAFARGGCDERRDSGGRDSCDFRDAIPATISWERPPPAETFSFEPSFFGSQLQCKSREQSAAAPTFSSFEPKSREQAAAAPTFSSFEPKSREQPAFSFEPSFFNSPQQKPKKVVAPRLPSPCGSADWFTSATKDLPVQVSSPIPTADVLVQEVVVSDSSNPSGSCTPNSDDELSLGWFSVGEQDKLASFTSDPLFSVDLGLHQPLAVPSISKSCSERE